MCSSPQTPSVHAPHTALVRSTLPQAPRAAQSPQAGGNGGGAWLPQPNESQRPHAGPSHQIISAAAPPIEGLSQRRVIDARPGACGRERRVRRRLCSDCAEGCSAFDPFAPRVFQCERLLPFMTGSVPRRTRPRPPRRWRGERSRGGRAHPSRGSCHPPPQSPQPQPPPWL